MASDVAYFLKPPPPEENINVMERKIIYEQAGQITADVCVYIWRLKFRYMP